MGIAEQVGQWITAIGGAAVIAAVLTYLADRRRKQAEGRVAQGTVHAGIVTGNMAALQAQLAYLEKIIDNVDKHNTKLQRELEEAEERERKWAGRVRELEEEVASLKRSSAAVTERCEALESRIRQLTDGKEIF